MSTGRAPRAAKMQAKDAMLAQKLSEDARVGGGSAKKGRGASPAAPSSPRPAVPVESARKKAGTPKSPAAAPTPKAAKASSRSKAPAPATASGADAGRAVVQAALCWAAACVVMWALHTFEDRHWLLPHAKWMFLSSCVGVAVNTIMSLTRPHVPVYLGCPYWSYEIAIFTQTIIYPGFLFLAWCVIQSVSNGVCRFLRLAPPRCCNRVGARPPPLTDHRPPAPPPLCWFACSPFLHAGNLLASRWTTRAAAGTTPPPCAPAT